MDRHYLLFLEQYSAQLYGTDAFTLSDGLMLFLLFFSGTIKDADSGSSHVFH